MKKTVLISETITTNSRYFHEQLTNVIKNTFKDSVDDSKWVLLVGTENCYCNVKTSILLENWYFVITDEDKAVKTSKVIVSRFGKHQIRRNEAKKPVMICRTKAKSGVLIEECTTL